MQWSEIRKSYPNQLVVIESLKSLYLRRTIALNLTI